VPLDQPPPVVAPAERTPGLDPLRDGGEGPHPDELLFQRAETSFRDALDLRSRLQPIRTISRDVSA
jgi:hypothetical protein